MATAYSSVNMDTATMWYGNMSIANTNQIQISSGGYVQHYYGNFSYAYGTLAGGTVSGSVHIVTATEVGKAITSTASYTDGLGDFESVSSVSTSTVANLTLNGTAINDVLNGGAGNDVFIGGAGNDTLTGGTGKDIFKMTDLSKDTIKDFSVVDDTIQLENTIFTKLTSLVTTGEVLNTSVFIKGTAAHDSNDFVIYNPTTGVVTYDADGNGVNTGVQM